MRRRFRFDSAIAAASDRPEPLIINIDNASESNREFRKILWTGENMQITLMTIEPGEEIGGECHENADQFIKIESGRANVLFGNSENEYNYERLVDDDFAILIPAGTWHNIVNTGTTQLKLYSIYAPPQHKS